jgi:LAGLIDADG DNA endonuclease family
MNSNLTNTATFFREHHLKEVILGILIASGSLLFDSVTKNWRLEVHINSQYSELVKLIQEILKDFHPVISTPSGLSGNFGMIQLTTNPDVFFNQFVDVFYKSEDYTFKRLLMVLEPLLTPIVLAFVCMIDGTLKSGQSKGYRLILYGYHSIDLQLFCDMLGRVFNLDCSLARADPENPYTAEVYISGFSYEILRELVIQYFLPSMFGKFPTERTERGGTNRERPENLPTTPHNRMPIMVSDLNGRVIKIYPSKLAVRKELHIGVNTLDRALLTGESVRGYCFKYITE